MSRIMIRFKSMYGAVVSTLGSVAHAAGSIPGIAGASGFDKDLHLRTITHRLAQ